MKADPTKITISFTRKDFPTFNLIIMVLMLALAARHVYLISQVDANASNVIFLLLLTGVRHSSPAHPQQAQRLSVSAE